MKKISSAISILALLLSAAIGFTSCSSGVGGGDGDGSASSAVVDFDLGSLSGTTRFGNTFHNGVSKTITFTEGRSARAVTSGTWVYKDGDTETANGTYSGDLSAPGTIELVILKVLCKGSLQPASDGQKRNFTIAADNNSFTCNFGIVKVIVPVSSKFQACSGTYTYNGTDDDEYFHEYRKDNMKFVVIGNLGELESYGFDSDDELICMSCGIPIPSPPESFKGNQIYTYTCYEEFIITIKTGATYKDPITVNIY